MLAWPSKRGRLMARQRGHRTGRVSVRRSAGLSLPQCGDVIISDVPGRRFGQVVLVTVHWFTGW
jgi:hypothetical protein